ncbi:MAG: hypothetical protein LBQ61_07970 [Spirochaetales bacterium]|jgi:nitroreductase|nr:hypothetical protein [Spirochaetales bacterium]
MKKSAPLLFSLLLIACTGDFQDTPPPPPYDASRLGAWLEEEGIWRTVVSAAFKTGPENAPTDEQLNDIFRVVAKTPTSLGRTDYFMVVLKDPIQQMDVVGPWNAHDGTVTVLVFSDRIYPQNQSAGGHPQQADRGYYNAGIASGYLNLAALSHGLGTHFYMTTTYTNPREPREEVIEDVYLKDKGYRYTLGVNNTNEGFDGDGRLDPYGNLKFVAAIVIGALEEEAVTQVTDHGYPENWVAVD